MSWVFLPETWESYEEIGAADILNGIDEFVETRNVVCHLANPPIELAPLVGKGVEFLNSEQNDKTLMQATSQLSYSFVENHIDVMAMQVDNHPRAMGNTIYFRVPIIVTTAKLYRLKQNLRIQNVKSSGEINDVADPHDILVYRQELSPVLRRQNAVRYQSFVNKYQEAIDKRLDSAQQEVWIRHLSEIPRVYTIINFEKQDSFERLIRFLRLASRPPKDLRVLLHSWPFE